MGLRALPEEFAELLAVIVGHAHLPRVLMHRLDHASVPLPARTHTSEQQQQHVWLTKYPPAREAQRVVQTKADGQSPVLLPEGGELAADVSLLADGHQRRVPRRRASSPCHTQLRSECGESWASFRLFLLLRDLRLCFCAQQAQQRRAGNHTSSRATASPPAAAAPPPPTARCPPTLHCSPLPPAHDFPSE